MTDLLNIKQLNALQLKTSHLPVKILQFGTGNFLRGFIEPMVLKMNSMDLFNGKIVMVKSTKHNTNDELKNQDQLYTLILKGIKDKKLNTEKTIINNIEKTIDCNSQFNDFLKEAENPDLRIIVSNTTEAGIVFDENDSRADSPPQSFPAKLLRLLKHRHETYGSNKEKGLLIFPCELIEDNGILLKEIIGKLAKTWYPSDHEFQQWLKDANIFFNTLVDRIVSGFPREEADVLFEELGYKDNLIVTGETYHFFAIEGPSEYQSEFPLIEAGLNVKWCDDISSFRTRKVSLLNGAHTLMTIPAFLLGLDTVYQSIDNDTINQFLKKGLYEEIIPTLDLDKDELFDYANSVIERFSNPTINHYLLSITLNSVSKFKTRLLPSLTKYINQKNDIPETICFSLASLILFYKGDFVTQNQYKGTRATDKSSYHISDSIESLKWFSNLHQNYHLDSKRECLELVESVLKNEDFWVIDLNVIQNISRTTAQFVFEINKNGIKESLHKFLKL
jgi:tagaturonate reductase